MFSLIVVIISIALVTALALASIYYGGMAFRQGGDAAKAAQTVNEGQQIIGAIDLYAANSAGALPSTLQVLVDGSYLSAPPADWTLIDGYAAKAAATSDICLAANQKLGVNLVPTYDEFRANPAYAGKALCVSYSS